VKKARIKKYEMLQQALENEQEINVEDYQTEVIKKKLINHEITDNSLCSSKQSKNKS